MQRRNAAWLFRLLSVGLRFRRSDEESSPMASRSDMYAPTAFDDVVVLEFYMPLSQETALRRTLDSLFYEDAVLPRLRTIDPRRLGELFGVSDNATAIESAVARDRNATSPPPIGVARSP